MPSISSGSPIGRGTGLGNSDRQFSQVQFLKFSPKILTVWVRIPRARPFHIEVHSDKTRSIAENNRYISN